MLHIHLLSGAGTAGPIVIDIPSGIGPIPSFTSVPSLNIGPVISLVKQIYCSKGPAQFRLYAVYLLPADLFSSLLKVLFPLQIHLYQKDKRALLGNLSLVSLPAKNVVSPAANIPSI
jgi:hypothetical protein